MTDDRRTIAWATKYRELLRGYVELLGGKEITPTRRALAETISTLQTELAMLTDRFAGNGRGGDANDLNLFLKLSGTVAELLQGAGLAPSQQPVDNQSHDDGISKITDSLKRLIHSRLEDEAMGIFRDGDNNVITDPARIALEKQIYALKQRRNHLHDIPAPLLLSPPSKPDPGPAPSTSASASSKPATKARAITPAEAHQRATQPMFPAPVSNEPTTTQLFYENGVGRPRWGPIGGGGGMS